MGSRLTGLQLDTLQWIADGHADGDAPNSRRTSARSLATRGLATVKGRGPRWSASITELGREWLANDGQAPNPPAPPEPERVAVTATAERVTFASPSYSTARVTRTRRRSTPPAPDRTVDSPAGKRRASHRPRGDALFTAESPDPWDEKILVNVKEAAWMLSLPEHAIRQAVTNGDVDRVFIGEGKSRYRIVYGSLLAWVNDMPRESARRWW
ncbi:excisionase [Nocardioides jejuensis]|uniref:Excisionase n=1 Tax=Nocardioides jejuensis TaxID=2502782 RepID=A0A4R1CHY7_9ACTN|nr:excisionase [Nocardioides jejuensis]